jgi:hypothetical protein
MSGLIVAVVRRTETGVAAGTNANIRTIGGAIGAAVVATVIANASQASGLPTEAGYLAGFAVIGVGMLAAAGAAALFRPASVAESPQDMSFGSRPLWKGSSSETGRPVDPGGQS